MAAKKAPQQRPASVTHFGITLFGLIGIVAAIAGLRMHFEGRTLTQNEIGFAAVIICMAALLPVLLLDMVYMRSWRNASTGLDWSNPFDFSLSRLVYKIVGLGLTLAVLAVAYWLFPVYDTLLYRLVFGSIVEHSWWLMPLAFAYIAFVDGAMREPKDEYWMLGYGLLRNRKVIEAKKLRAHALAWIVKGFFAPMMLVFLMSNVEGVLNRSFDFSSPVAIIYLSISFAYLVDLVFAAGGYLVTLRLTDTHIRSVEPTTLGWLVALICYPPFWIPINQYLLPYGKYAGNWQTWLTDMPMMTALWGGTLALMTIIYALATVVFGLRFSNLTYRGIITGGPYRLCKHPAYLSKNIGWWLMSVPFIPLMGWENSIKACLMLSGVSFIYYMRAITEERHLSRDPVYVEYSMWMNDHGPLRFLNRVFPWLRYKVPQAK